MRRACRIGVLAAVGSTLALTPRDPASTRGAEACGPFALNFAFVRVASPEDPQAYVAGAIGVVRPSFRLPWLVTAYRHLAGRPLGAAAQRTLAGPLEPGVRIPPGTLFGTQRWLKARSDALNEPEASSHIPLAAFDPASGAYFDNCSEGAFESAAKTLQARVAALGAATPAVVAWVAAQDRVWANCGRDRGSVPQIPAELDASATPQARADRAYQIAAATFYAGQWDAAVTRFRAIAADRTSPWQPWGDYLAGRALPAQGHDRRRRRRARSGGAVRRRGRVREGRRGSGVAAARVRGRPRPVHRPAAASRTRCDSRWPRSCSRQTAGASFSDDLDEYRYLFLRSEPAATPA